MRFALIFPALSILIYAQPLAAGTVSFDPPEVFIEPAIDSTIIRFDVTVALDVPGLIQGADIVLGSHDLSLTDFDYTPPWPCDITICDSFGPPGSIGAYTSDLFVGGYFFPLGQVSPSLVGTLTVDATLLPPGSYQLIVDSDLDGGTSNVNGEALFGLATVHVIPEPATVAFLLIGMLLGTRQSGTRTRLAADS